MSIGFIKVIFKLLYAKGVINSREYEEVINSVSSGKNSDEIIEVINSFCKFVE